MATKKDIERWARELSDEDAKVRQHGAWVLETAALNGADISVAVPTLVNALSDEDVWVRRFAAGALKMTAKKSEINLEEVKKALARFVEKEKIGTPERKTLELEAGGYYVQIANAISKRRQSIGMEGLMLPDKIKPPKGPKMFRQRVAV